jgi:hypothetical protein
VSLSDGQWYTPQVLTLLDGVVTGEQFLVVAMLYDAESNTYLFQEPDLFESCQFPQTFREITKNAETIYNEVLYNYNIVNIYRDVDLRSLRYLEINYLNRFVEVNINRDNSLICIEELSWLPNSAIVPQEVSALVLWQENELLRLMIQYFGEKSKAQKNGLFVVYSGLNDNHEIYHLFACIPENIHPEMAFPIILDFSQC